MIINGKNAVLGRLASYSAKQLLKGEEVIIINAEQIIMTGRPNLIKNKYLERRRRGSPQHGPFFPKSPDAIVRRTVRGMLPYKTNKGRAAFKKLRVKTGNPDSAKGESVATKTIRSNYVTVGNIAKTLGWKE